MLHLFNFNINPLGLFLNTPPFTYRNGKRKSVGVELPHTVWSDHECAIAAHCHHSANFLAFLIHHTQAQKKTPRWILIQIIFYDTWRVSPFETGQAHIFVTRHWHIGFIILLTDHRADSTLTRMIFSPYSGFGLLFLNQWCLATAP